MSIFDCGLRNADVEMFEFLDHPSEAYIQVTARSVEEAFHDAAMALFELMTNPSLVQPKQDYSLVLEAGEKHLLLIDWLNRLILLHESENIFLCRFVIRIEHDGFWKLFAVVSGEPIGELHERRSHAKSATYSNLEWQETKEGHQVRFVVDI